MSIMFVHCDFAKSIWWYRGSSKRNKLYTLNPASCVLVRFVAVLQHSREARGTLIHAKPCRIGAGQMIGVLRCMTAK